MTIADLDTGELRTRDLADPVSASVRYSALILQEFLLGLRDLICQVLHIQPAQLEIIIFED